MFLGEYEHTIDEKCRLAIPAKYRAVFAEGLVVTKGLDRCLFVYTEEEWKALREKTAQLPITSKDARSFTRFLFAGASDCQLDRQGRFLVPAYLRNYARLNGQITIIGVDTRLEIWNREAWQQTRAKDEEENEFVAEHLANLGI